MDRDMAFMPSVAASSADWFEQRMREVIREVDLGEIQRATLRACQYVEEIRYKNTDTWMRVNNCTSTLMWSVRELSRRVRTAELEAAERIRKELVCCRIYERVNDLGELTFEDALASEDWHDLCYWGEAAARLAMRQDDKRETGT